MPLLSDGEVTGSDLSLNLFEKIYFGQPSGAVNLYLELLLVGGDWHRLCYHRRTVATNQRPTSRVNVYRAFVGVLQLLVLIQQNTGNAVVVEWASGGNRSVGGVLAIDSESVRSDVQVGKDVRR